MSNKTPSGNITTPPIKTQPVVSRDEYFEPCYEHLPSGSVVVLNSTFTDLEEALFHIESLREIASYYNQHRKYFVNHVIKTVQESRIDL